VLGVAAEVAEREQLGVLEEELALLRVEEREAGEVNLLRVPSSVRPGVIEYLTSNPSWSVVSERSSPVTGSVSRTQPPST
jgi:hypothetical protein